MPLHDEYLDKMLAKKRGEVPPSSQTPILNTPPVPNNTPYWIVGGTIIIALILIRLLFFGGSDPPPPAPPTPAKVYTRETITIQGKQHPLTLQSDGGKETDPIQVGKKPTVVDIGNGNCLYLSQNRSRIKMIKRDGPKNDARVFQFVSVDGRTVDATFTIYNIAHPKCSNVR